MAGELTVTAPGMPPLRLTLDAAPSANAAAAAPAQPAAGHPTAAMSTDCRVQILGDSVSARPAGAAGVSDNDVAAWCATAVGAPCTLVRQSDGARSAVLGRAGRTGRSAAGSDAAAEQRSIVGSGAEADQAARLDGPDGGRAEPTTLRSDGGDSIGARFAVSKSGSGPVSGYRPGHPLRINWALGHLNSSSF